ncbi:MAG: glycosyltransferase [archaeon]|nr:glycosyltransferase [archaeon]
MNICLISDRFATEHGGGGTTYANSLAKLLSEKHNLTVSTIDFNNLGNEYKKNLEINRIKLENSPWTSNGFMEFCRKSSEFVSANSFDIVHAVNPSVAMSLKKNSFITTAHGSSLSEISALMKEGSLNFKNLKQSMNSYFAEMFSIHKSLQTISTSNACRKEIAKHYFYPKTEMIYYCVDSSFVPSKKFSDFILFSGRLSERKGIMTLLKAIKGLEIELHIVGEGDLRKKIEQFVKENNLEKRVKLFGWLNGKNLLQEFQNCKFLVTPSNYEIFGIVNIEAMACGKSVIASNVSGIPEIVKHNENGLLCRNGNVQEFQNAIKKLYYDDALREKLEKSALKTAEKFNENIFLQKHLKLYEKVISK